METEFELRPEFNVVVVRHTETDWNVQERYSGQSNIPVLTSKGVEQAYKLGKYLQGWYIERIFCSDLQRAQQTALIIGASKGIVPITDVRLREVAVGKMDGMVKEEARLAYPEEQFSTRSLEFDFSSIGGESRSGVIARLTEFFDEHIAVRRASCTLVVGHGTAFRAFLESRGQDNRLRQGEYRAFLY